MQNYFLFHFELVYIWTSEINYENSKCLRELKFFMEKRTVTLQEGTMDYLQIHYLHVYKKLKGTNYFFFIIILEFNCKKIQRCPRKAQTDNQKKIFFF